MTAIQETVKARNIKQKILATQLGISKAAVSMQLKNGIKTLRTANRYSKILKCNPFFLLDN